MFVLRTERRLGVETQGPCCREIRLPEVPRGAMQPSEGV